MTEIETRAYIKELSSKPTFWIKDAKGGYFDIESFGLALIEVFTKSVIKEYKASLEPVAWMYVSSSTSCDRLSLNRPTNGFIPNTVFELYALGETK